MSSKSKFSGVSVIVFIILLVIAALFRTDPEPVAPIPVPEPGKGQKIDAIAAITESRDPDVGINELKELLQQETRSRLQLEHRIESMNKKLEELEATVISLSQ